MTHTVNSLGQPIGAALPDWRPPPLPPRAFELGYRRYEWKCDTFNEPSRTAAQRYGFSFEGVFRQANVLKGRTRDSAWFSVVDGEWPALRAAYERWLAPENFAVDGRQRVKLSSLTAPLLKAKFVNGFGE